MSKTTKIPMAPLGEPEASGIKFTGQQRQAAIRAGVLQALGLPAQLFQVTVVPLWGDKFRVNVVTGENACSVTIPNSYFVTADDLGNILGSTPHIKKQY